ncbi:MAG: DUF3370 domain-containing protein [Oscillatoriales cyanobacterium RM2_1_1]|nr:DUF3370 domain-containing protein [Oscillatoriales cyanobacterium SM2_3_0]NJO44428.1 DUF3370 domain-containing protein [Oscillatoriales cyanobacterium RM2_1_1]
MKKPAVSVVFRAIILGLTLWGGVTAWVKMTAPQAKLAQAAAPQIVIPANQVRPLPGQLDTVPMFNSNSPEWVKQEGILLSTFPPIGKTVPAAHLNFPLKGKFELFAHHFVHTPPDLKTLYIGILVHNPGTEAVTLDILTAASYLMEPDAPFKQQPTQSENPTGAIYSGPGIRAVDMVLRGQRQAGFPAQLVIPPGESRMLMNHPIPVQGLERPVNGRSTFMQLNSHTASNQPASVYLASLALYGRPGTVGVASPQPPSTSTTAPTLAEWQTLLTEGKLALPRDKTPTPPDQTGGQLIYSRVAGVQTGSQWKTDITDAGQSSLTIPNPGQGFSYVISTVRAGTLGTQQVQSAPLMVRYPDTAYESHANYGVHYDLTLPLSNPTNQPQSVAVTLETPMKEEVLSQKGLIFRQPPWDFPYFRSTVRLAYEDDRGEEITRYVHLWQRRGQLVDPLVTVELKPQETRRVRVDFRYPPDSVPPQVLTVKTLP